MRWRGQRNRKSKASAHILCYFRFLPVPYIQGRWAIGCLISPSLICCPEGQRTSFSVEICMSLCFLLSSSELEASWIRGEMTLSLWGSSGDLIRAEEKSPGCSPALVWRQLGRGWMFEANCSELTCLSLRLLTGPSIQDLQPPLLFPHAASTGHFINPRLDPKCCTSAVVLI